MDIFDKLILSSKNKEDLSLFISNNIDELYDFLLTQNYLDLSKSKDKIYNYILSNKKVIKDLDFNIESTYIFITLLLDTSERFGLFMPFQQLYKFLLKNNCIVASRIEASAMYLIGIRNISDYENIIDKLLTKLSKAFNEEGDSEERIIGTIINFYSQVVNNFGLHNRKGVIIIKEKLLSNVNNPELQFLKNNLISEVLSLEIIDYISDYNNIQKLLDAFLKRTKQYLPFVKDTCIIEENTDYCKLLENTESNFNSIKQISVLKYRLIADDSIFYSLQSGVKILTEEKQLYSYFYSYGDMHYKKLTSSFAFIPQDFFNKEISIIDWGCGQGFATMSFLDFINSNNYLNNIKNITLIEPSLIALKRAALHISKFNIDSELFTINKDLNSLTNKNFKFNNTTVKLHLFSNILDIDEFSLTDLIELLNSTFQGENYFVCVSPYISDLKTGRLQRFMESYSNNNDFEEIKSINNKKGHWSGTNWSRVVRVFKTII